MNKREKRLIKQAATDVANTRERVEIGFIKDGEDHVEWTLSAENQNVKYFHSQIINENLRATTKQNLN